MTVEERVLDGNAAGGLLLELFGVELTAAPCVCGGCGAREEVARLDVYVDCPGVVMRCRHCGDVVLTVVQGPTRTWIDLRGTRRLELS